jgi:hypothetical protein
MSYWKQELLSICEHTSSPRFFGGVRVAPIFSFLCCVVSLCFVCLRLVSCVPIVVSVSMIVHSSLCLVCPLLSVSPWLSILHSPSVFSYFIWSIYIVNNHASYFQFYLQIIFAREYTQAEKQAWHVQHFCCWFCDAPLAGQRYIANNGNPYCIVCFDRLYSKVRS